MDGCTSSDKKLYLVRWNDNFLVTVLSSAYDWQTNQGQVICLPVICRRQNSNLVLRRNFYFNFAYFTLLYFDLLDWLYVIISFQVSYLSIPCFTIFKIACFDVYCC